MKPSFESNKIFHWQNGILIRSMLNGDNILLDEISLADDAVIERINSVLEESRSIVLNENSNISIEDSRIFAHPNFNIVATMNPSGDFGKKEVLFHLYEYFYIH